MNGGIRILPGNKGPVRDSYPLYANLDKAIENSMSDPPTTTLIVLSAGNAAGRSAGSVVLYRKFGSWGRSLPFALVQTLL